MADEMDNGFINRTALLMQAKSLNSSLTFTEQLPGHFLNILLAHHRFVTNGFKLQACTHNGLGEDSRFRYRRCPRYRHPNPLHLELRRIFRDRDFFDVSSFTPIVSSDDHMPYYIYERWSPALRLATTLLERARPFLERVMFAPVLWATLEDPFPVPALSNEWKPNAVYSLAFERELRDLSRTYRIYRCPPEHPTHLGKDFRDATAIRAPSAGQSTIIYSGIQDVVFAMIGRFYFDQSPVNEQENVFLMFAVTLLHELAHAINFKRYLNCINLRGTSGLPLGFLEPAYRRHELLRELGLRLEIELFGGEIQVPLALNSLGERVPVTDGSRGLEIDVYVQGRGQTSRRHRLAPATIRSLFQRQAFVDDQGKQRLLVLYLVPIKTKAAYKLR